MVIRFKSMGVCDRQTDEHAAYSEVARSSIVERHKNCR